MTNVQALILGCVQGLTEYIPVSSSAHLVLVPKVLGWQFSDKETFVFDVLVQLGTLFGVIVYFFGPLKNIAKSVLVGVVQKDLFHDDDARIGWLVVLATIPAAVIGFSFKAQVAKFFSSPIPSCYFLMMTGLILALAEMMARILKNQPTKTDAFIIGCAQSLALLPGISRSGATIAAGMACGLSRKNAAQFSFLLSIPVMVGASMLAFVEVINDVDLLNQIAIPLMFGFMSALVTGYLVIKWFMAFLAKQKLLWFSVYCVTVGLLGVIYFS